MADTTTTTEKKPTLEETFKTRETDSQAGINKAYDNNLNTRKQGLLDAYNQNTQAQANQQQDVQNAFKQANYDIGVQNNRNDANLTQFADVRDVNTGLGSQHQLRLGNARAGANAKVGFAQQQALAESQRQAALIETNYKNQVAAALADNDYKRAAALMDDYNNQNKWREQQAAQLASFGNFDPYKQLYGNDTANTMQTMWNAQHPEEAYRLGNIDAEKYRQITGRWPAGYNAGGGGYGGWYGGSPNPKDPTGPYVDADGNIITAEDVGWRNTTKMLGLGDQSHKILINGRLQTVAEAGWKGSQADAIARVTSKK